MSAGKDLKEPLLVALAQREDGNRSGKMVVCYHIQTIYNLVVLMAQPFHPEQW